MIFWWLFMNASAEWGWPVKSCEARVEGPISRTKTIFTMFGSPKFHVRCATVLGLGGVILCHLVRRRPLLQSTTFGACWACQGWNVACSRRALCHSHCPKARRAHNLQASSGPRQHHHGRVPVALGWCCLASASGVPTPHQHITSASGVPHQRRFALSVPPQRCCWRRFVAVCKGCWNATGWRSLVISFHPERSWMRRWLKLGVLLWQCAFFSGKILEVYIFSWFPDAKILWW